MKRTERRTEVRPNRFIEGWMVAAVVIGLAIGSAGIAAKMVIASFAETVETLKEAR